MIRGAVRWLRGGQGGGVDPVTGLPDRWAFFAAVGRGGAPDGVLVLGLGSFREVVEALGHATADRLLAAVAGRLRAHLPADDLLARLDGDQFAIMVTALSGGRATVARAAQAAELLAEPVVLDGLPLDVSAAIGMALYPEHGGDVQTLTRHADTAMSQARSGPGVAVYSARADHHSAERLALLADLRTALANRDDQLSLHYQPQIELASGRMAGVEALLRWRHPERGHIQPARLVDLAERTALMRQVTERVLGEAVAQAAAWRGQGYAFRVSVNVSGRDLHHEGLVDGVAALLRGHDVPADQLQVEITESALMIDPPRAVDAVHRLARLGVGLSLDDFGTGYSSLRHLRRLPLSEVKVDRSFVLGMAADPQDAAVARAVVRLGGELGLRVVAEGVEDDRTRRMLAESGCGLAQGWLFAAPMPAAALPAWLTRYDAARRPVAGTGSGAG